MKDAYKLGKSELLRALGSGNAGLRENEASARLGKYGENRLDEGKKQSLAGLFFAQFKDLMTVILICAAVLSGVLAYVTRDLSEIADTGILLFVILLNAVVGFVQQYRADSAIEKLKKLSRATAKAVREGKVCEIDATLLVPGDVVEIAEGDRIPADCRILSSEGLRVDESSLTGESKPVQKRDCAVTSSALAERENTVHMGTFCVGGSARCLVTATGMETEMGQIAKLLHRAKPAPSPLDRTVEKLGKVITVTVLIVAAVLFLGGILARRVGFLENLMSAVAVAVAAIPEGMGAVVTIILAMGVQRMSKARAVMRKLSSVETLGSCTCICSDKTGTLTKNKMTVEDLCTDLSAAGEPYAGTAVQKRLLRCIRLCHTVKGEAGSYLGDPTEVALLEYADRCGYFAEGKRLGGVPFSSERKFMSVAAETEGKRALFVKGGAEVVLARCGFLASGEGKRPLTQGDRDKILAYVSQFSAQAKRVLAFAEGEYPGVVKEEHLTFLGLVAMYDPPKEGAKEAVAACRRAGVRTVMITGDSAETAFAIARSLGIAKEPSEVVTGEELDEGEAFRRVKEISVYARVSPKHKQQIVKALQDCGEVVAMTGDGVNDAPSVRAADIGVAMGSGTDVTKDAADMVIENDDFSAMVHAVEEGRNVFCNIKRTISFFLSTNFAEVLSVLFATLFLWKYNFLTSTQLLWINLITDSLPVLALGVERTAGVMERPPVSVGEIFGRKSVIFMLVFGLLQTAIVLGLFLFGLKRWGNEAASTCAFLTLSLLELFHAFNVRKERGRTAIAEFFSNRTLLATALLGIALNVLLAVVPFLAGAFGLVAPSAIQWLAVFGCSFAVIPLGELYKYIAEKSEKFKKKRPAGERPEKKVRIAGIHTPVRDNRR